MGLKYMKVFPILISYQKFYFRCSKCFKKKTSIQNLSCNVKENVSRHLYTYSVSINVALSEYLSQKEGKTIRATVPQLPFTDTLRRRSDISVKGDNRTVIFFRSHTCS